MSMSRLGGTATVMTLIAGVLTVLSPGVPEMAGTVAAAQHTVNTAGPDVLVLSAAGLLAWAVWAWGALGLALTAASTLPGLFGGAAGVVLSVVLPAGARRRAALALGLGLGVAAPLLGTPALMVATASATAGDATTTPTDSGVPDWPAAPGGPPDWPAAGATTDPHVVVPGDCLWHLASDQLQAAGDRTPTNGEVAVATHAWWQANTDVIGPDPDLLLPGQVLSAPSDPGSSR